MGRFEKYLSVWVALAILAGLGIGSAAPALVQQVLANPSITGKAIKQQITSWRADYFRA